MDEQPTNPVPVQPQQPVEQAAWVPATPGTTQPPVPAAVPKKGMPLFLKLMIGCGALFFVGSVLLAILFFALIQSNDSLDQLHKELEKTASFSSKANKTVEISIEDKSDWKSFDSEVCALSFKYPKVWVEPKEVNVEANKSIALSNIDELGGETPQVRVNIECTDPNPLLEEYNKVLGLKINEPTEIKYHDEFVGELKDTYIRLTDGQIQAHKSVRAKKEYGYKDLDVTDGYEVFVYRASKLLSFTILGGGADVSPDQKVSILDSIITTISFK